MHVATTILMACFWCSAAAIFYAYLGYPAVIYILSRIFGEAPAPPALPESDLPTVALLIVAYNEAEVIEQRIQNALALEYPRGRIEIVIASDGSNDGTHDICCRYQDRVRLLLFPHRRGKAATLSAAIAQLDAPIVVLSDANTSMDANAVRRLIRWFADPNIGAVCGRLILSDPLTGRNADSLYWRYETFLKRCEGRLGGLLGANGAIYALRRELFEPLPPGTVVDDFVIPLRARLRSGCRIAYDPHAIAYEETAPDLSGEFRRRARIGIGGFQAIGILWPLLSPHWGWTAFTFWSHKVLRWAGPFFLLGMLLAAACLAAHPFYRAALAGQIAFYAVCMVGACRLPRTRVSRALRICSMFAGMNLALLIGFLRWLRATPTGIWTRTARHSADPRAAAVHI